MRIKINGVLSEKELEIISKSGADEVGIFVGQLYKSSLFILASTAARLVHLMPPGLTPVLDTHLVDHNEVLELVDKTGIHTINLHCWNPEEVQKLRDKLPHYAKIILTWYLDSPNRPLTVLDSIYPVIDAISLDCCNPEPDSNSTGTDYPNWEAAAKLLPLIPIPCYLAGGICKETAPVGVETLKPYGIEADGELLRQGGALDALACRSFADNARTTAIKVRI